VTRDLHNLVYQLGDISSAEPPASEVCYQPPTFGLAREGAELSRALPGKRQGDGRAVTALRPVAGHRTIDFAPLHTHGHEVSNQPSRSSTPGGAGFDVALGKGGIVQEAELGDPLQGNLDGGPWVALALQPAGEISPGKRSCFQGPQRGSEGRLDVGCRAEPLLQLIVELPTHSEIFCGYDLTRDRPKAHAVDLDPHRVWAPRIGIESRYSGYGIHLIVRVMVGAGAGANSDRGAHAQELFDLAFHLGQKDRIVAQEQLGVFPALADALIAVGVPGA